MTQQADYLRRHALEYAANGWAVLPLAGKTPAFPNPHPQGSSDRYSCKGECGLAGHGVLDATTDLDRVSEWWALRDWNIGLRVPESMVVLDFDPRNGGFVAAFEEKLGEPLTPTLVTMSGRGDGGGHWFYRRPLGVLSASRLGAGIDLKTSRGYVVGAPSIHPDTGWPYVRIERLVAPIQDQLAALLRPIPRPVPTTQGLTGVRRVWTKCFGASIADTYSNSVSWADILVPHGWTCLSADPDADGARWLHPTATSPCSASVRHGKLFVFSTSTAFEVTESGRPKGCTRFRAYAVLNHGGNTSAAARALKGGLQ